MAIQTINTGETAPVVLDKLNGNFTDLDDRVETLEGQTAPDLTGITTDDIAEGDTNKYASNTTIDARITAAKGAVNGIADLDSTGRLPIARLPESYVNGGNVTGPTSTNIGRIVKFSDAEGTIAETTINEAQAANAISNSHTHANKANLDNYNPANFEAAGSITTHNADATAHGGNIGKIKVSDTDTTPARLISKLVAGTNVQITQNNTGGNETITISATEGAGGSGDMTKALYDANDDGRIDEAALLNDGAGNSVTPQEAKAAVTATGKVKVNSTDTADYLVNQLASELFEVVDGVVTIKGAATAEDNTSLMYKNSSFGFYNNGGASNVGYIDLSPAGAMLPLTDGATLIDQYETTTAKRNMQPLEFAADKPYYAEWSGILPDDASGSFSAKVYWEGLGTVASTCESAWTESVASGVTSATDTGKVGTNCAKLTVGDAVAANTILATTVISGANLTDSKKFSFWVKSSVNIASGALKLIVSKSANCATEDGYVTVGALTANTWTRVDASVSGVVTTGNIISIGIKQTTDIGASVLYIDDVRWQGYVVFAIQKLPVIEYSSFDGAWSTAVTVTDISAIGQLNITPASGLLYATAGGMLFIRLSNDTTATAYADTSAVRVYGVRITYNIA